MTRTIPPFAVLATGALLLSACVLNPVAEPPRAALPAAWDTPTAGAGQWPDATWWQGFGNAELNALIAEAEANNRDLAAAVARIEQAEAAARAAAAALLPTLGASGGTSRSWAPNAPGRGASVASSYQGTLQVGYEVDLFGRNAATASAARSRLEANAYDLEAVALTLRADVAATFFQLLSARDRLRLAGETLRIAEEVLALLERQVQIGLASDLELAQQRSSVASQRASVTSLQQAERQSLDALAVLLGRAPQGFAVRSRSLDELTLAPVTAGLPSELLTRRPDVRAAEADLRAAAADRAAARAARFPSLSLTARGGVQSAALGDLLNPASVLYNAAASLAAPLFEGGRLEAQEDQAAARAREVAQAYHATVLTALRDTEDALSATTNTEGQRRFAREAQEQAAEALRIVNARFRTGTVPFLNVLDAQRTVFQANDAVVQATLARFNAQVSLYKALGGGWDGRVPEVSPPPSTAARPG
ncbi:efflux transporter outer membrane subunit [Azospirillum sp.]|uniref:efflux transporter outer membrane subunit n=1 Tax=Azospirillum sp. TaxID=34012 RepID=UPI002D618E03|nr:efflux transporter outer membrane subunit [Azospirillum sp.]HYD65853.1 efflux transporter outer membrane subunit [Azospirillum sp.]